MVKLAAMSMQGVIKIEIFNLCPSTGLQGIQDMITAQTQYDKADHLISV